jgi:hypothetical protein
LRISSSSGFRGGSGSTADLLAHDLAGPSVLVRLVILGTGIV